jgi:hypothetical protein
MFLGGELVLNNSHVTPLSYRVRCQISDQLDDAYSYVLSELLLSVLQSLTTVTYSGDYTIKVRLRHDSVQVLEKYMDLPMRIDKTLTSDISVPIFRSLAESLTALEDSKQANNFALRAGERYASSAKSVC